MSLQYDKTIPVLDNHCHVCFSQPIDESLADYEKLFRDLAIAEAGLLSCPESGHSACGTDILENLKMLYLKDRLSVPCYAYAGFTWHWNEKQPYADFARQMLAMGFDGFKTLEQHPRVRRKLGKGLDDPSFEQFFEYANACGSVMVCHVGDPRPNWDLETATPEAIRLGRVYADGFLSLEELYAEMDAVIARCPDMKFILAHFYFMSDDYGRVCRLLDEHPNVYLDLTPGGEMYVNFTKDPLLWRAFFLKYSKRIILGSDNYALGYGAVRYNLARSFLEGTEKFFYGEHEIAPIGLPREVLEDIYRKNVHALLGGKPKKIDRALAYEHCCRIAANCIDQLDAQGRENLRVMTDYWHG